VVASQLFQLLISNTKIRREGKDLRYRLAQNGGTRVIVIIYPAR
jgi:hypothetical protein